MSSPISAQRAAIVPRNLGKRGKVADRGLPLPKVGIEIRDHRFRRVHAIQHFGVHADRGQGPIQCRLADALPRPKAFDHLIERYRHRCAEHLSELAGTSMMSSATIA
jgi:hypothetical protein